jgi:hypothetical protein
VLLTGIYAITQRKEKVSAEERQLAVSSAVQQARQKAENELATAMEKANKDKETAIKQAVKKAMDEAIKAQQEVKA